MRELKVTDVDGATLVVTDDEGNEFRVPVDETSLRRLRHSRTTEDGPRVSPKDIQSHLRAGLSNDEISALTGASLDLIQRFETPVLAEREFIITSALSVPTQTTVETDTGSLSTAFGTVITQRLHSLNATAERWATWKEETGSWVVKLEFTANAIEHDARWSFEPRKRTLTPVNSDATTLSQRGELSTGLIPKLRAVGVDSADTLVVEPLPASMTAPVVSAVPETSAAPAAEETREHSPTADLLEALRKRRNDRETTPAWLKDEVSAVTDSLEVVSEDTVIGGETVEFDATLSFTEPFDMNVSEEAPTVTPESKNDSKQVGKNGRPSMPSWDDIVFGTRSDDDPA
ncbi:septation protein SepH [uncultured Aurantimicrobium sp.]|uniref:septation protein SepH n=1 Tax=uncultured Aurantimicrobium sp. TaxID=1705357 RepID=UPI00260C0790|nr:septation protein SepH [uncultured Aurantimicrobium sp.]